MTRSVVLVVLLLCACATTPVQEAGNPVSPAVSPSASPSASTSSSPTAPPRSVCTTAAPSSSPAANPSPSRAVTSTPTAPPTTSPPVEVQPDPRVFPAIAYDALRDEIVMYGGSTVAQDGTDYQETWLWRRGHWTLAHPVHSPPPLRGPAMTFDAACGDVVLFGGTAGQSGCSACGRFTGDTWTWDGTDWTQRTPAHTPPVRELEVLAYDPALSVSVMLGGFINSENIQTDVRRNDTWEWNGSDWSQVTTATRPDAEPGASMAYQASSDSLVLFGSYYEPRVADTWTFDGRDWTRHPAAAGWPPSLRFPALAPDPRSGQVILFGGDGQGASNDTWAWNGTDWLRVGTATAPSQRSGASMAADISEGFVLLFGGGQHQPDNSTRYLHDTWTWNGTTWTQVS